MAKFIIAIMGTALIVAGGFYFLSPKLEPKAPPVKDTSCISQEGCYRACFTISYLQTQRLLRAKRLNQEEFDKLTKDFDSDCVYACQQVTGKY